MRVLFTILPFLFFMVRAEGTKCSRPDGWCSHAGAVYEEKDCDGDGVADPTCSDRIEQFGVIRSSQGCSDTWPRGSCTATAAFEARSTCGIGQLALKETKGCQADGYTCTVSDGPRCCDGRAPDRRLCIPCDETRLKKKPSQAYTTPGSCASTHAHHPTTEPSRAVPRALASDEWAEYFFQSTTWGPCSVSCGKGTATRVVDCMVRESGITRHASHGSAHKCGPAKATMHECGRDCSQASTLEETAAAAGGSNGDNKSMTTVIVVVAVFTPLLLSILLAYLWDKHRKSRATRGGAAEAAVPATPITGVPVAYSAGLATPVATAVAVEMREPVAPTKVATTQGELALREPRQGC